MYWSDEKLILICMVASKLEQDNLCLSTLQANDANHVIDRIIKFFPSDQRNQLLMDLSLNVKAITSQRLLPTLDGGRAAAIEVLINTPRISDLILKGDIQYGE